MTYESFSPHTRNMRKDPLTRLVSKKFIINDEKTKYTMKYLPILVFKIWHA